MAGNIGKPRLNDGESRSLSSARSAIAPPAYTATPARVPARSRVFVAPAAAGVTAYKLLLPQRMQRICPACGSNDRQQRVCQLWDRPHIIQHCLACDRFYGVPVPCETLAPLSDQEQLILKLTAAGCLNKQIAKQMGISVRTLHLRRFALMAKLGVRSRWELIRKAIELGFA